MAHMVVIVIQQYLQLVALVVPVCTGGSNAQATSPVQSIVNFGTGGAQHGIAYSEQNAGSGANGTCFNGGSGGGSVRGGW